MSVDLHRGLEPWERRSTNWATVRLRLICFLSTYSRPDPDNVLTLPTASERNCVALATFHSNSSKFAFRHRMKDVDCRSKAAFVCAFNPGENFNLVLLPFLNGTAGFPDSGCFWFESIEWLFVSKMDRIGRLDNPVLRSSSHLKTLIRWKR